MKLSLQTNIILNIIVFVIGLFIGMYIVEKKNEEEVVSKKYIIEYTEDYNIYTITIQDSIKVSVDHIVFCIQAPCNPIHDIDYKLELTKEYKTFVKELFKNNNNNSISITPKDLSTNQKEIIDKIIAKGKKNNNDEKAKPELDIKSSNESYGEVKQKGYSRTIEENKTIINVYMGEKNTGGYSIKYDSYKYQNNHLIIYVKEDSPSPSDVVTMALTAPYTTITIEQAIEDFEIRNIDTGEIYNEINPSK